MDPRHEDRKSAGPTRRQFVQSVAAAGAGLALAGATQTASAGDDAGKPDDLRIALIGAGSQGRNLLINCLRIPGIRFAAVCDIWPYHQRYASNILKKFKQDVNVYADYREMLAKEKDLDAAIVATPDWVHAEQAADCMEAGLHVYCEKEMSNTLDGCRRIVAAARKSGKVCQIGHQRRSNPRYQHALTVMRKDRLCGRVTHAYGQWNRSRRLDLGWPKDHELDAAALKEYGYDTMERLRNWRWYKKYSGGPMADLGSHQVDVFNWFLGRPPISVMASGGLDYYGDREWYDNVMAIYVYPTPAGIVRAFYQVLNTTSFGGYYEQFMGDDGTLVISEDARKGIVHREVQARRQAWEDEAVKVEQMGTRAIELKIGETLNAGCGEGPKARQLLAEVRKPIHQLHLENFFDAVRVGDPKAVTCRPSATRRPSPCCEPTRPSPPTERSTSRTTTSRCDVP